MTTNSDVRLTELSNIVKHPAVAGYFYPDDPQELRHMIEDMLNQAAVHVAPPKALIAPHAGYIYSGPVAAHAYATLLPVKQRITRVVLLGPAHRVYLKGLAISRAGRFATPLGLIEIDQELKNRVTAFPQVSLMDEAFAHEHSLEVHLPFLQTVLDDFTLLPLVVGEATADQVADVLESVWGGEETLIVISSDLSHYHDYETATRLDGTTAMNIRTMQHHKLGPEQACGCRPLHGLLQIAKQKKLEINQLDLRNSGDTAGGRDRVVGYGAFSLHQPHYWPGLEQQQLLLDVAHNSIEQGLRNDRPLQPDISQYPPPLHKYTSLFVTLTLDGKLRGCIGNTEPVFPMVTAAAKYAYGAAFSDPRFPKLSQSEFRDVNLYISVLTEKTDVHFDTEQTLLEQLQPGIHGLVIAKGDSSATFLPSVWESLTQPEDFLAHLKLKAGIGRDQVPDRAWTYLSTSFGRHNK